MPAAASRLSRNTAVNRSACRTVMLVALSIAAASLVGLSQAAPASANYGNGVEYSVIAGANPGEWAAAVSGCDGTCPASLTIPAVIFNFTFGPLRVTEIADGGFNIGTSVPKRVNLPTTIKKIGAGAFSSSGPSNLERIDLPASLETIGQGAFAGTSSLTAVVFYGDAPEVLYDPASSLSPAFFQAGGFSGPATAYVADSTLGTYGPDGSFFANLTVSYERPPGGFAPTALTYENRGDSVAVTGCDGPCPASVTIPATIEGLPVLTVEGQFVKPDEDSYQLKAVTLPDGIQSIGSQAFANASGLTSINLPTSLTSIGDSAFEMAQSLSTIDLPEGLTTIGENAFVCTTLSSITIPSTVTSIGKQAFACSSLSSVYFQGNAPTVGFGAFGGISRGAKAILASSSLTGYGYNGALFKGLIVSGGLNDPSADTTKPSTPSAFTGVPSNPTSSTTATIGFTLGEAGGTVECKLDTGSWSACTSASGTSGSKSLSGLGDGAHTLSVRQTDAAGNVSNVATTSSWTVDATAPTAPGTFTGVPSGQTASVTATIAFSLGEADGTVECRLDTSSWGACTSVSGTSGSIDLTGLALGTHTLSVRQTDATGNVSTVGTTASWSVVIPTLPPTVLTPAAGTKTVYKKTVDGSNTWAIKTGLLFSTGGDTRSAAQFLTVQVAVDSAGKPVATKPSDSLAPPTSASFNNGVLAWSSTGEVTRSSAATPVWVRVGNKMGRWSAWVKLTA